MRDLRPDVPDILETVPQSNGSDGEFQWADDKDHALSPLKRWERSVPLKGASV